MTEITLDLKKRCVEAFRNGMSKRKIYDTIFLPEHIGMSFATFKRKHADWCKRRFPSDETLEAGTYNGYFAHGATVQVNGNGDIVQAWIKQSKADAEEAVEQLLRAINENVKPFPVAPREPKPSERMLEINLADLHFGLKNDYQHIMNELLTIVSWNDYDEINIVIGQDNFHNDGFTGRTTKGTQIEKIDLYTAWNASKIFWCNIIQTSLHHANNVNLTYVKGNHDASITWAFVQMLLSMFPQLHVDDTMAKRKCISWKGCFIGLTHGDENKGNVNDLRGQFTIAFPEQFAGAKVREIHCSHLHHEREADVYGVMIRRLSTGNITDEWSDDNGFIGAHKRFMIFEYAPNRLRTIYYLGG